MRLRHTVPLNSPYPILQTAECVSTDSAYEMLHEGAQVTD